MATEFRKKYWIKCFSHSSLPNQPGREPVGFIISYDIVKAHGGEIKVNTKENEGTAFIISIASISMAGSVPISIRSYRDEGRDKGGRRNNIYHNTVKSNNETDEKLFIHPVYPV